MINEEMLNLYNAVNLLQEIGKTQYEFNFSLIEIKKKIKVIAEVLVEKEAVFTKQRGELVAKYCAKDEKGRAITYETPNGNIGYKGLARAECPEFDKESERLAEARKKFLKEEVKDFDIKSIKQTIKKDDLPTHSEKFNGFLQEQIQRFIREAE